MAQNSAGIKLGYGTSLADIKFISGITSIPDIGGEPETLETTTLDNLKYTSYIAGLQDLGGSFGFEAYYTPELVKAVNEAGVGKTQTWYLVFPDPIAAYYSWTGAAQSLPITGVGTNEVIPTTLYITVEDELDGPVDCVITYDDGADGVTGDGITKQPYPIKSVAKK